MTRQEMINVIAETVYNNSMRENETNCVNGVCGV